MLLLSLIWLAGGLVIGWLVWAAALPAPRNAAHWPLWRYAVTGAIAALAGGWLGSLLLGRLFGSPVALWVCVVVCGAAPYLVGLAHRATSARAPEPR